MKRKYIQVLFDRINGGDDVEAAEEIQEISEGLLRELKTNHREYMEVLEEQFKTPKHDFRHPGLCPTCQLIARAEGKA